MARDDNSQGKGFIAGAVFGALIGGLAALLLAPKSGQQTKEDLKARAKSVKSVLKRSNARLDEIELELQEHINDLKEATKGLRGADYEDSQRLITRAELLKNDLQDSAARLATNTRAAKHVATADAKRLMSEGQAVLDELSDMTSRLMSSARNQVSGKDDEAGRPKR